MIDRELLEAAAKAAGIELWLDDHGVPWMGGDKCVWNPLTDDGDALRLAVRLEIDLCFGANYVIADGVQQPTVNNACDPYAAVRRAIVRAAAELAYGA
jgi:hypothetical protein